MRKKQGGEEDSFRDTYLKGTRGTSFLSVSIPGKYEPNSPRGIYKLDVIFPV